MSASLGKKSNKRVKKLFPRPTKCFLRRKAKAAHNISSFPRSSPRSRPGHLAAVVEMALQISDVEALKEYHQFLRDDDADATEVQRDWRARMARKYYDQLYKEYAIIDLSRSEEGQVGLRWRTKEEVLAGRGHFYCAAKGCTSHDNLRTFELPFQYIEHGEEKLELVKVRVCGACSEKLLRHKQATKQKSSKRKAGESKSGESAEREPPRKEKRPKKRKHS